MTEQRSWFRRVLTSDAPAAVILIRFMVGGVFLSEGLQKFLFPDHVGAARFAGAGAWSLDARGRRLPRPR